MKPLIEKLNADPRDDYARTHWPKGSKFVYLVCKFKTCDFKICYKPKSNLEDGQPANLVWDRVILKWHSFGSH